MMESLGVVEFVDLDTLPPSQIGLRRLDGGGIALFLDQNTTPKGGWGGDCEVGFDKEAASRLLDLLRDVQKIALSGPKKGWEPVDSAVKYSWCDSDGPEEQTQGLGHVSDGHVSALARRGVVRLVVSPKWRWGDYSLTMPAAAAKKLTALVRVALASVSS
jgi:hypothetical protein